MKNVVLSLQGFLHEFCLKRDHRIRGTIWAWESVSSVFLSQIHWVYLKFVGFHWPTWHINTLLAELFQGLEQSFSVLSPLDILGRIIVVGSLPLHSRTLSNIPGLYPLSPSQLWQSKCLRTLPNDPWGQDLLWLGATGRKIYIMCTVLGT